MAYKIAADKLKHFYVGIPLGFIVYFISAFFFSLLPMWALLFSFIILVGICYGFEIFSWVTGKGHGEHMDAVAGIIGGMIGIGACWGLLYLLG